MTDRSRQRQAEFDARRREMSGLQTAAARHDVRLVSPEPGLELVCTAPGHDGDLYALWSSPADAAQLTQRASTPGGAEFATTRTARPVRAVITAGRDRRVVIDGLELAFPIVAPLPDGHTLVVGARAWWRPDGAEENAVVVGPDGQIVRAGTVGDGVADVRTTPAGRIWIGFHDEGIFGNFGWGGPGPEPIGSSGIVRFDADLTVQWQFDQRHGDRTPSVDDCYALNVVDETVWSCYYSDFPIVCIDGGGVTSWRNDASHGARALAVGHDRVLLAGGYGAERDRLVEGRLVEGRFEVISERRLTLPDGAELPADTFVAASGPDLVLVTGSDCYRLTVG